ncbi:cation diffusion facilitator family transporter [Tahibacter amnicola]|uniref:Cation diffusion facilitator family transporter n=1 Tax=Tahibacter amnicola TaxID=2976241 RepID=A0ABY6BB99_9GAMM|nr:cation diffusion facilitator family transporter [Tahibacter amnicola]UXI67082.1 cation diffusion facilitator family transporter [Tahibacter amnicola]
MSSPFTHFRPLPPAHSGCGHDHGDGHDHSHGHDHAGSSGDDHAGDTHGHSHAELDDEHRAHLAPYAGDDKRIRRLLLAFGLTTITLFAEAVGGWLSGSLALLADAGHMLVDALALLFAWLGARFARRPADSRRSFGYARLEVLVGYTNAVSQLVLVLWIVVEAVMRFLSPAPILSGMMLAVAVAGLCVNVLVLQALGHHDHDDLNTAGARLHVIGDLLGSVGAVSAALVVRYMGWLWADPAISIFVAALILFSAVRLLKRSAHILLEGVPEDVRVDTLVQVLEAEVSGVREVHHVHVWQLAGGVRVATLHARLNDGTAPDEAILAVGRALREHFRIEHVTVQLDGIVCSEPKCEPATPRPPTGCHHAH